MRFSQGKNKSFYPPCCVPFICTSLHVFVVRNGYFRLTFPVLQLFSSSPLIIQREREYFKLKIAVLRWGNYMVLSKPDFHRNEFHFAVQEVRVKELQDFKLC